MSAKVRTIYYILNFPWICKLSTGSTKGKSTWNLTRKNLNKQTNPIEADDTSSASSLSNNSQGDSEKLNGSDNEEDNDFYVAQMTDREAREMFNDEVSSFILDLRVGFEIPFSSCPKLQFTMQLCCSTMITTSKLSLPSLIAAGKDPALRLRDPPRLIPKGGSTMQVMIQVKRRLTRTTPSFCTIPWHLEVRSGRSLARWARWAS